MENQLEATFVVEKDTKNTRRFQEEVVDSPPVMGTVYIQKWALRRLNDGQLPDRIQLTISLEES